MGGQGRGVLSDFKMTRVSSIKNGGLWIGLTVVVQFPNGGYGWKLTWCEASQLVKEPRTETNERKCTTTHPLYTKSTLLPVSKSGLVVSVLEPINSLIPHLKYFSH